MASWKTNGNRLYLAASYRKDGKVNTRYLKSWSSIQEALADLSDARVIARLRRKDKNLDIAKLRMDLETPGRFASVPRHARTALQVGAGRLDWDGVIEWDLGRDFWKRLRDSLSERIGVADLTGLNMVLTLNVRDAIWAFRSDVEAATRDLQRRLMRYRRDAEAWSGTTGPSRADLRDAMEGLGLHGSIEKLDAREVRKRYRMLAQAYHPDKGGRTELFQRCTAARDLLMSYLDDRAPSTAKPKSRSH